LAGEGDRFRAVGREIDLRPVDVVDHAGVVELPLGAAQRQAERQARLIGKLHHLQERTLRMHGGAVVLEFETPQARACGGEGGPVVRRVDHDVASRREHRPRGLGRRICGRHGGGRAAGSRWLSGEGRCRHRRCCHRRSRRFQPWGVARRVEALHHQLLVGDDDRQRERHGEEDAALIHTEGGLSQSTGS